MPFALLVAVPIVEPEAFLTVTVTPERGDPSGLSTRPETISPVFCGKMLKTVCRRE